jgi:hypothetical protein
MALNPHIKRTLTVLLFVIVIVGVVSTLFVGQLTKQHLRQSEEHASFVARQVFIGCRNAIADTAHSGVTPASSNPTDLHDYVQRALNNSNSLYSLMESVVGVSPTVVQITVSDSNGIVLASSDISLRNQKVSMHPSIDSLVQAGLLRQLRALYGQPQNYEYSLPFNLRAAPFADIRVGLSSKNLRDEISPELRSAGTAGIAVVTFAILLAAFAALKVYDRYSIHQAKLNTSIPG